jgi:hypothetical protein
LSCQSKHKTTSQPTNKSLTDTSRNQNCRYRICKGHADADFLVLDGAAARWCQLCGRFQPLADFDAARRTCRGRLDRHNAARRASAAAKAGGAPGAPRRRWRAAPGEGLPSPSPAALPLLAPPMPPLAPPGAWAFGGGGALGGAPPHRGAPPPPPADLDFVALDALFAPAAAPPPLQPLAGAPLLAYEPGHALARISVKAFACRPEQLVPAVRAELEGMLRGAPTLVEGYVRPGCTHLTLSVVLSPGAAARGAGGDAGAVAAALLRARGLAGPLAAGAVAQAGGAAAVVRGARVVARLEAASGGGGLGAGCALAPALAGASALAVQAGARARLTIHGAGVAAAGVVPLCRQRGRFATLACWRVAAAPPAAAAFEASAALSRASSASGSEDGGGAAAAGAPATDSALELEPLGLAPGVALLEAQRGALLSAAFPLLVLPRGRLGAAAAAEVNALAPAALAAGAAGDAAALAGLHAFLFDAGMVLQSLDADSGDIEGAPAPPPAAAPGSPAAAYLAAAAARTLAAAAARGWLALAALLAPAARAAARAERAGGSAEAAPAPAPAPELADKADKAAPAPDAAGAFAPTALEVLAGLEAALPEGGDGVPRGALAPALAAAAAAGVTALAAALRTRFALA